MMAKVERSKTLYKIKGMSGEYRGAAVVRVAAGALQMSLENKDNKTIRRWIDDHVPEFKWSQNWPSQINNAFSKAKGGKPGRRPAGIRDRQREQLSAAIYLLREMQAKHGKELGALIKETVEGIAESATDRLAAWIATYPDRKDALKAVELVEGYGILNMPKEGSTEHTAALKIAALAKAQEGDFAKLKKAIAAHKPNPVAGLVAQYDEPDHARVAIEAIAEKLEA
jgi:hypothetical protein